jgi:hypothetical protein
MAHAGEDHRHPVFIGCADHFLVPLRTAWLNHRTDACLRCGIDTIAEWKKCV